MSPAVEGGIVDRETAVALRMTEEEERRERRRGRVFGDEIGGENQRSEVLTSRSQIQK